MNASVKLLEAVLPSSVSLRVAVPETHPSAQILGTERMGSGTIIDPSGIVLTVNYVVLGCNTIQVTLLDGTTLSGELAAQDIFSGLAAVRLPPGAYPSAPWKSSAGLELGQEVFILAAGEESRRRINAGVVSSLSAFDAYWEYCLDRGVYTTAMNPGLGGGSLFTVAGYLAGIVALDLGEIGRFTLAIPVEYFLDHREELLRNGRRTTRPPRAWVGLFCYEMREHVVVAGVLPGAPGERAGLKPGDVILGIEGTRINERRHLYELLWAHMPGERLTFQVFRQNAIQRFTVTAADAEEFFA